MRIVMAKRRRSGHNGKKDKKSTHRRNDNTPANQKKVDLIIFFVFVIIILAIIGSYFLYEDNRDKDDGINLIDGDDNQDGSNNGNGNNGNNGGSSNNDIEFQRTVLIETFTSTDCYWCNIEEEPALKRIADDFTRDEVVIVAYHGYFGDDPYEIPAVTQRGDYYGGISGTPNVWVDGVLNKVGGTGQGVDAMYSVFESNIKQRAEIPSSISIDLSATVSSSQILVTADLEGSGTIDTSQYSIRFVVTEDGLPANGKIYDWIMRDYAEQSLSGRTFPTQVQEGFDMNSLWTQSNLNIVAFVQDNRNSEIAAVAQFSLS
jgi:hypothetical protein